MKFFLINFAYFFIFFSQVYAADNVATPSTYKVTMKKVELCTASTGVSSCVGSVTVGDSSKVVDIASVSAGAAAATFGDPALLPLGETYTHMRVTIDRKFTIKADLEVSGVTDNCTTTAALSGSSYPGGSLSGNEKYDRTPIIADGGTAAEADLYLKNDQMKTCTNGACSTLSGANTITYAQNSGSSTYQTQHADGSTSDDHVMVYKLTTPYTVALIAPTIDISFGTSAAIKATEIGTDFCMFDPQEPVVTITIN